MSEERRLELDFWRCSTRAPCDMEVALVCAEQPAHCTSLREAWLWVPGADAETCPPPAEAAGPGGGGWGRQGTPRALMGATTHMGPAGQGEHPGAPGQVGHGPQDLLKLEYAQRQPELRPGPGPGDPRLRPPRPRSAPAAPGSARDPRPHRAAQRLTWICVHGARDPVLRLARVVLTVLPGSPSL